MAVPAGSDLVFIMITTNECLNIKCVGLRLVDQVCVALSIWLAVTATTKTKIKKSA